MNQQVLEVEFPKKYLQSGKEVLSHVWSRRVVQFEWKGCPGVVKIVDGRLQLVILREDGTQETISSCPIHQAKALAFGTEFLYVAKDKNPTESEYMDFYQDSNRFFYKDGRIISRPH